MLQITMIIALAHVIYCPFTKVEESFNLQAMHDILYHKFNLSQYDHLEFPGVVPRTFIGPLFVSMLASPVVLLFQFLEVNKFYAQYVVRAILSLCVVGSLKVLTNTLEKQFGSRWLQWFVAVTITQSHFMFYLSRPLPNIMALPLALLALDGWLNNNQKRFIIFSGAAVIIFRFELALFLGLLLLHDLYYKRITIKSLLQIAVPGGAGLLLLTFVIDSIFWNRPLWPEGEVLWYNTILNKSSDWGTSPFLWYFYSAIPRGLAASTLLVPLGFYLDQRVRKLVISVVLFVFIYSFLPHKELRFIIYVFPFLNVAAATACHRIWENRNKTPIYHFLSLGVAGHLAVNVTFTLFLLSISGKNYPGGTAISHFHRLARNESSVHVHIANLAAQSGVSRFTQINPSWIYNKTENLEPHQMFEYTHLIAEGKSKFDSKLKPFSATHDIIYSVEAFHQVSFNYLTIPPVILKTKPVLFILKRKHDYKRLLEMQGVKDFDNNSENLDELESNGRRGYSDDSAREENTNNISNNLNNTANNGENIDHVTNSKTHQNFDAGLNTKIGLEKPSKNKNLKHRTNKLQNKIDDLKEQTIMVEELPKDNKFTETNKPSVKFDKDLESKTPSIKKTIKKIVQSEKTQEDSPIDKQPKANENLYRESTSKTVPARQLVKDSMKKETSMEKQSNINENPDKDTKPSTGSTVRQSVKDSIKKIKSKLSDNSSENFKTKGKFNESDSKLKSSTRAQDSVDIKNIKYQSSEVIHNGKVLNEGEKKVKVSRKRSSDKYSKSDDVNGKTKEYSSDKLSELKEMPSKTKRDRPIVELTLDDLPDKSDVEREIEVKIEELRRLLDRLEKELTGKATKESKNEQNDTEKEIEAKIEELSSKEVKLDNETDEKRVKQNIKKIVQKYRRKKQKFSDHLDTEDATIQISDELNESEYSYSEKETSNRNSKQYNVEQKSTSMNGKEIYSSETVEFHDSANKNSEDVSLTMDTLEVDSLVFDEEEQTDVESQEDNLARISVESEDNEADETFI